MYGSTLESDLVSAWEAASAAVQKYGSYVEAVEGVKDNSVLGEHTESSGGSKHESYTSGSASANSIIKRMRQNSIDWFTANDRKAVEKNQQALADKWYQTFGEKLTPKNGSWYRENGEVLYTLTDKEVGAAIVSKMKENAAVWHTADKSRQEELAAENERLAQLLENFLGVEIEKTKFGVWKIGDKDLFEVYHDGGIVGEKSKLKSNEVIAKLEAGELIIPKKSAMTFMDMINNLPTPLDWMIRNMARVSPEFTDTVRGITNNYNNDNKDFSVSEVTVNNENHFHIQEKLDKDEIWEMQREIGEISANHNMVYRKFEGEAKATHHIVTTKTEAGERIIPMLSAVREALETEFERQKITGFNETIVDGYTGFVFQNRYGDPISAGSVDKAILRIYTDYNEDEIVNADKEGREPFLIRHFSVHNLRHTFCTRFCENETNIKVIQEIMGHADIETTMNIYAEATERKKKDSFENLEGKIKISGGSHE